MQEKSDKTVLYVISKVDTCGDYCSKDCDYLSEHIMPTANCRLFNLYLDRDKSIKKINEYFRCNDCLNNAITSREI